MLEAFLNPDLLPETQTAIRIAYGSLLVGTLLFFLRHGRRFFLSSRYGGYSAETSAVTTIQNPLVFPIVAAVWLTAGVLLTFGQWTVAAAAVNAVCCWYFFVAMRWSGLHRGFGAPGFMTWWLGMAVFLLEFTSQFAPQARSLAILAIQADFAFIMLSAGIYKSIAGYAHNEGMNYGLANPAWGYWPRQFAHVRPNHWFLRIANHLGWSVEIIGAVMMLIPGLRFWGGLAVLLSFVYVWGNIRLGTLCGVVIACCLFFFVPGSLGSNAIVAVMPTAWTNSTVIAVSGSAWLTTVTTVLLTTYLALLPVAHAGLFYNFLSKKSLPKPLQTALTRYTNMLGLIIWRVFSADHTRFFVRIYAQPRHADNSQHQDSLTGKTLRHDDAAELPETLFVTPKAGRRVINDYAARVPRFRHVVESITLTCIFTSRRYFASRPEVFEDKLVTYARTLPHAEGEQVIFQYVHMEKMESGYRYLIESELTVDLTDNSVTERAFESRRAIPAPRSVVFESASHGSYVAKGA